MYRPLICLIIFALMNVHGYCQEPLPSLPEEDYAIYEAVVDGFAECDDDDEEDSSLRNGLLFVASTTEVMRPDGFDVNIRRLQNNSRLDYNLSNTVVEKTDWTAFLSSIDTTLFARYAVRKRLTFKCRRFAWWTPKRTRYYFGASRLNRGYSALRKRYRKFAGIVSFSKVVYSADRTKAVLYYSQTSDYEAGSGTIVFLERKNNRWEVVGSRGLWIS